MWRKELQDEPPKMKNYIEDSEDTGVRSPVFVNSFILRFLSVKNKPLRQQERRHLCL